MSRTKWWRAGLVSALVVAGAPAGAQQVDAAPAAARLRELVGVIDTASEAGARQYVQAAYAPEFLGVASPDFHASYLLRLRRPGGLHGSAPRSTGDRAAIGFRNDVTEEIDTLVVRVESAAPYRIAGVSYRDGAGGTTSPAAAPASDAERAAELRRYVQRLAAADQFSGVVLFAKAGKPLVYEAYGVANRDFAVPVRKDTKFNLGSANKNFTAVVIAQLVQEGKLSWEDPLAKFLPDFPDSAAARKIRIKHLLSHTAGLGSYFNERFMQSSRALFRNVDDFMNLARPDSLRFEPGTDWSYSNTGFLVLGKIIEIVEGRSYYDVVRDRIYRPLGMTSTDAYELDHVNPNLAVGYIRVPGANGTTYRNNLFEHVIRGGPAGGGYSNAEDMLRYAEALRTGRLISRATLELMRSPKPELHAPNYGYGFALFEGPGIWGHGGDFPGIDFDLEQYGDSGYTIIIMANYDRVNDPILRKVRSLLPRNATAVAGK